MSCVVDEGTGPGGPGDAGQVTAPPLGALTWPGSWVVIAQRPAPGARLSRWDNVVIEFEELRSGKAP